MGHTYTTEYYAAIKKNEFMSFARTWMKLKTIILRDQHRAENQILHVLTHKWELNNEDTWTKGGQYHTLGPVLGWEAKGGIALGEVPNIGGGLIGIHSAHTPQNLN